MIEVEVAFSRLGRPGRFHVLVFICLGLNNLVVVLNHLAMVVFAPKTPFRCHIPEDLINGTNMEASVLSRECSLSVNSTINGTWTISEYECPGRWDYEVTDNEYSIIMQYDLVCGRNYLIHLSTTTYFVGVMLGGLLFGTLSDMFGRKPFVLLTLYAQIGVGVWIAFSSNYVLFTLLRFVQGILMQGLQTTSIVLIMELFQHQYSAIVGSVFEVFWGIGVMWLALIAYLLKNWQHIQLTIALSSVITVVYIWLIPESLRWLVLNKKYGKAERLLAKAAKFNNVTLPPDPLQMKKVTEKVGKDDVLIEEGCDEFLLESELDVGSNEKSAQSCGRCKLLDMFKLDELRRRSLIQFYIWFVVTASYYGLSLRLSSFAGDRYLNFFYGGLCELPAYCVAWMILARFGRRGPLVFYLVIGGITGVTAGVTSKVFESVPSLTHLTWIPTTMAVLSRVSMAGCFSILWLYSSELYPTVIRNMGVGACTFWMRVGAMVSPQILLLGDVTYPFLPIIVFGTLCLAAGGLTFLLPETINMKLPETFGDIKPVAVKCFQKPFCPSQDAPIKNDECLDDAEPPIIHLSKRNDLEEFQENIISELEA